MAQSPLERAAEHWNHRAKKFNNFRIVSYRLVGNWASPSPICRTKGVKLTRLCDRGISDLSFPVETLEVKGRKSLDFGVGLLRFYNERNANEGGAAPRERPAKRL